MTFGKLGESFELAAIKSAGISPELFMRPFLLVAIVLSGASYLFANKIIPVVSLRKDRLMFDIISSKLGSIHILILQKNLETERWAMPDDMLF